MNVVYSRYCPREAVYDRIWKRILRHRLVAKLHRFHVKPDRYQDTGFIVGDTVVLPESRRYEFEKILKEGKVKCTSALARL